MSENTTIKGYIEEIQPLETFSSGFRKQCLIIKTEGTYPQVISIEFLQDKVDLLNSYKKGENVSVSYNINGRPWTSPQGETKYFNSIVGWRIEKIEGAEKPEKKVTINDILEENDQALPF